MLTLDTASQASPSASSGHSKPGVYQEFWEMPSRFWRPRIRELEDAEMDAIVVSDLFTQPSRTSQGS
jgi:hypothetical protein